jgi:two-component system cell cycle sensor histidine kinase/response regulator CckA
LSADTYPVMCNDTQINQLLINLCNNAVDALPEKGGMITIGLLNETIDKGQTKYQTNLKPGQYAKLMVSDNGIGMDTKILDRVFEPYFTTKKIGEGTGIGMAVVHGIVEKHGGAIAVDSKPGRGTTFTIFLPAHEGLFERETEEQNSLPIGDEHILYVDDEPSIATLGKRLLESLGYTAESTTDPEKALNMVRNDPNKFDLLITDMAMPNMTGDQLVIETLKIRQDMPTIICTGYSAKISEKEAADIGVRSYIMKPIRKSELAKTVRKVLDGAKSAGLVKP